MRQGMVFKPRSRCGATVRAHDCQRTVTMGPPRWSVCREQRSRVTRPLPFEEVRLNTGS
jgi:hypothetical protein